jgi:DNA-binding NarL/FixJ family response regulator
MTRMPKIRVLIGDDHAVLRAGLKLLINAQSDMEVVGEAADGAEALSRARDLDCDVVLLDLTMPGSSGTAVIGWLKRLDPAPRILVLTGHDDPAYLRSALRAGASGYVVKSVADVDLLAAIRVVHQGGSFVRLTRLGETSGGGPPAVEPSRPLSRRELEVLRLLAQGHSNQEVADRLTVSVKTIETHRRRVSDKLGLKTRAELFRFAVEAGMLERDSATSRGNS